LRRSTPRRSSSNLSVLRSATPWRSSSNWSLPSYWCKKTSTNRRTSNRWSCICPNLLLNCASSHRCRSWWPADWSLRNLLNRFFGSYNVLIWGQASSLILN
jgi:hypothetical protein